MATKKWRTNASLRETLAEAPEQFEMFQALQLLHLLNVPGGASVRGHRLGNGRSPGKNLRYQLDPGLGIKSAGVSGIAFSETGVDVTMTMMTLSGSQGVLPSHYTEMLISELRQKNTGLKAFFELFNQRTFELLYQAWLKHRLPQSIEYGACADSSQPQPTHRILAALMGLHTSHNDGPLPAPNVTEGIAGLYSRAIPSAQAVQQIAEHHLGIPVTIEQFKGEWVPIPTDLRSRLPGTDEPEGMNNRLGANCLLGRRNWFIQGRFTLVIQAIEERDLLALRPDKPPIQELRQLLRFAVGQHQDFNLVVKAPRSHLRTAVLGKTGPARSMLGWNTALASSEARQGTVRLNIH